jgi:hypothetical protein
MTGHGYTKILETEEQMWNQPENKRSLIGRRYIALETWTFVVPFLWRAPCAPTRCRGSSRNYHIVEYPKFILAQLEVWTRIKDFGDLMVREREAVVDSYLWDVLDLSLIDLNRLKISSIWILLICSDEWVVAAWATPPARKPLLAHGWRRLGLEEVRSGTVGCDCTTCGRVLWLCDMVRETIG